MPNYLKKEKADLQRSIFSRAIEMGLNFKLRDKVLNLASFDELMHHFRESFPKKGLDIEILLNKIENELIPFSMNYSSPYAMAFPDSGNATAGITGDILTAFLNQNLINWLPCSPVGTIIEMIVLNWFRELVGFPCQSDLKSPVDVGGLITSGGVSANTIALLLAREKAFPDVMKKGLASLNNDYSIIVPESINHYSSRLSAGWLGLGERQVVPAPVQDFKYNLVALKKLIKDLSKANKKPFFLVCYAGDSRSMTCDDFRSLHELCQAYQIWMHVDGCHGTQLLFSEKHKFKLDGIELADSITFDPHKTLNVPYSISLLLVKDQKNLELIRRPEDIITGEEHSFGQLTPFFGSKAFFSLKLYMLLKNLGLNGLKNIIETRCEMAQVLADEINRHEYFLLINPKIDINSVIFMFCPDFFYKEILKDKTFINILNMVNEIIQKKLLATGEIWLHTFSIPDLSNIFGYGIKLMLRPLRFMSGNPILEKKHINTMLEKICEYGAMELARLYSEIKLNVTAGILSEKEKNNSIKFILENNFSMERPFVKDFSLRNNLGAVNDSYFLSWRELCPRTTEIMLAIRRFCSIEFHDSKESYFVMVYGSYAYKLVKPSSDLDIVFFTNNYSKERRDRIISFIKQLHIRYGMKLDNEIPYENKILISYEFLLKACQGDGVIKDGQWDIPEIEKNKQYLSSKELLLRFFMGVMVNPNILVAGNTTIYNAYRDMATRNLIRAVIYLNKRFHVSSVSLAKDFCVSTRGEFGDYYLGFSHTEPFISYLVQHLEQTLSQMDFKQCRGFFGTLYEIDDVKKLAPERIHFLSSNDVKEYQNNQQELAAEAFADKLQFKNHLKHTHFTVRSTRDNNTDRAKLSAQSVINDRRISI